MKILAVGGGSGGHVTPVVAVLRVLRDKHPKAEMRFWCDRKFYPQARDILGHFDADIPVRKIYSGKFRRYHHLPWWKQLTMMSIVLPNIRDSLLIAAGIFQSIGGLIVWRPDVVFTKGGFVCLPVGIAARLLGIPLVIHDSDAHPGLTNRVLSRFATFIATGAPLEFYTYPAVKTSYVGIPVSPECVPFDARRQAEAKADLGFDSKRPLIVVTGGGLGAKRINNAVIQELDRLTEHASVMLIAGSAQYDELLPQVATRDSHIFQLHAFVTPLIPAIGAADIVVSRAGATTLLELAAMAKPTILIPNAQLTGGHQLKNAEVYQKKNAVKVIDEQSLAENPTVISETVATILDDSALRHSLSDSIHAFAKPHAAIDMAELIDKAGNSKR